MKSQVIKFCICFVQYSSGQNSCIGVSNLHTRNLLTFAGLDVSSSYIAVQYYIESGIDIYDRKSFKHLFRLDGHEYGGQCLKISDSDSDLEPPDKNLSDDNHRSLLYSASMDCSLKSWNLKQQCMVDSIMDHCDYVQNLTLYRT